MMSHKSKVKCLSYHSEASLLPLCSSPSPSASFQPSKMLCIRKCKFPVLALLMFPFALFLAPPQTKWAEQMARVFPQCLTCVYWEESRRGSAHSEQAALTPTTGCSVQAVPLLQTMHPLPEAAGSVPPFSHVWYAWARLQEEGRRLA